MANKIRSEVKKVIDREWWLEEYPGGDIRLMTGDGVKEWTVLSITADGKIRKACGIGKDNATPKLKLDARVRIIITEEKSNGKQDS